MKINNWTLVVEQYIREGRPVSGGCGPSSALKAVNQQIQGLATQVQGEGTTIFGDANQVFNKVTGALNGIIAGGPGQNGWSASENAARTAQTVQAGAAEARNLKGAAASSVAAIGGGNTVAPAGSTQAIVQNADIQAASDTAAGLNQNQIANAEAGRSEFNAAIQGEENATQSFNPASTANQTSISANQSAFQSQQEMDNQSNWAMNDIMKLGVAGAQGFSSMMMCPAEGSQYLVADDLEVPVETLRVGGLIMGIDGELQTIEEIQTALSPIVRVETEDGFVSRSSRVHAFALPHGGFVVAIHALGKTIRTKAGTSKVKSVSFDGVELVFNVITDGSHTYRADGVWALGVGEAERVVSMETWNRIGDKLTMAKGA
jgi:hypothetical protein